MNKTQVEPFVFDAGPLVHFVRGLVATAGQPQFSSTLLTKHGGHITHPSPSVFITYIAVPK